LLLDHEAKPLKMSIRQSASHLDFAANPINVTMPVADIDTALEQQIFYLSQGQRITDIHHHREADHLRRTVEITEGILHCRKLRNVIKTLKPICSDNAVESFELGRVPERAVIVAWLLNVAIQPHPRWPGRKDQKSL
jgi:hypothetical protein